MYQPLADLLRPQTLDEVYGQEHILGRGFVCPVTSESWATGLISPSLGLFS